MNSKNQSNWVTKTLFVTTVGIVVSLLAWTMSAVADFPKRYMEKADIHRMYDENKDDHREIIKKLDRLIERGN